MFCVKCGNEISEGGKFCGVCGNPVGKDPIAEKITVKNTEEKKRKVKLDKKILLAIGAVVVVLVFILLFKGRGKRDGAGFSSPEEAFDAWMAGYMLHDFDLALRAEPDFVIEYNGGEAEWKEALQKSYDVQIAKYGEKAGTFKFEAVGHTKLEKDEVEKIEQRIKNTYGIDVKISEAAIIHYRQVNLTDGSAGDVYASGYAFIYKEKWYYVNVESVQR